MKITVINGNVSTVIEVSPNDAFTLGIGQEGCIDLEYGNAAFIADDSEDGDGDDDDDEDITPSPMPPLSGRFNYG